MHARLTVYDDVDLDLSNQAREWLAASGEDPFRHLPGYHGSMTLLDRAHARLVGIGFYASADDAEEAGRRLPALAADAAGLLPDAIRPILDLQPVSVEIYEIVHRD
jgi:hypothetical protein